MYASQAEEFVSSAVVARLTSEETRYFGFWPNQAFPGRAARAAHPDVREQLGLWRAQLSKLAAELAAGDTRIFVGGSEDAEGPYAPLTRVFEQLALARGAVQRW